MKAELRSNGMMVISAETPTEEYALRKWWEEECRGIAVDYQGDPEKVSPLCMASEKGRETTS